MAVVGNFSQVANPDHPCIWFGLAAVLVYACRHAATYWRDMPVHAYMLAGFRTLLQEPRTFLGQHGKKAGL